MKKISESDNANFEYYLSEVKKCGSRMSLQSPSGLAQGLGALANAIAALAITQLKENNELSG